MSGAVLLKSLTAVSSVWMIFSLVVIAYFYQKEGKDERGELIFNKFFRFMFFLLSVCIAWLVFLAARFDFPYELYRRIIELSLCLTYVVGTVRLLVLRKRY
ncbi:hypothetical protein [Staphylospora marina]|uniref:hypothetical protein n=1 Tax=Staphylospora marina TaxID=2490858 RepID=UPI000F5B8E9C|nr:hypothetical protein [Staphylospora marina]